MKKVIKTTEEKVFNLCVESAKRSESGYTFDLKEVWQAARIRIKLNKQQVMDSMEIIAKEHEIKNGDKEGTYVIVELMPKEEEAPKPFVQVEEEIIEPAEETGAPTPEHTDELASENTANYNALYHKARYIAIKRVKGFTSFTLVRYDATNNMEYKNYRDAARNKADMNNLLFRVKVVDDLWFTARTRIEAYQNFLSQMA